KWLSKLSEDQLSAHYVRHVEGWTDNPYTMNVNLSIVKEYHGKTIKEILDSPPSALRGMSDTDAAALLKMGVKTVREVGVWRPFLMARAIVTMAPTEATEDEEPPSTGKRMNIRNSLDAEFETVPLKQVPDLEVSALSILPDEGVEILNTLNIRTIKHLGTRKLFQWANALQELEQFEA
ncbi:unnamed protein product, partial [Effrenium voratum]